RLRQVFWNLLSNAVKFTPKGGTITITARRVNSHVEVAVQDSGKGISREFLPSVFERFRQEDTRPGRPEGGLGLGLAIVRNLVELHGGTVECDSPGEGLGAVFTVKLPLAPFQTAEKEDEVHPLVSTTTREPVAGSLDGLSVLVVDDEIDTLDALAVVLAE